MLNYVIEKAEQIEKTSKKIVKNVEIYESNKKEFVLKECETMITDIEGKLIAMKRELRNEINSN